MILTTQKIIGKNVLALRKHHKWSQATLGKKAGISQRTVSNIESPRNAHDYTPTLDVIERLAECFGIEMWQLSMPAPLEVLLNRSIEKTLTCYAESSPEGRENIARIAENEMRYNNATQVNKKEANS